MADPRGVHPGYAMLWAAWYLNVLVALTQPELPVYGLWVLLLFLPVEALAVTTDHGSRDTLSEITTWVFRRLSKHERAGRGWNALLLVMVVTIAWLLGRTVHHYTGSAWLAWPLAVLVGIWIENHWRSPGVHG